MSTIKVTNIQATGESAVRSATSIAAAWVNYNHATETNENSYNVSGVTDVTTGEYQVNYTNNMANAKSAVLALSTDVTFVGVDDESVNTASSVKILTDNTSGGARDRNFNGVAVFGDLA